MLEGLADAVRTRQVILFAGAGVSMNLGLPSWEDLIREMASDLGFDPDIFRAQGSYLELAEYYRIQKTALGPLRSWMDRKWHTDESKVDGSKIHQAIVDLGFPIIYTTNYDRWIEFAFDRRKVPFIKIANVGDFTKIRDGATQIVKFHGDFDDDASLVLNETSYFERMSFESPLDIKFRADTLGKSILFVGYSLSDINIRYLLYKLHRVWSESQHASGRPESYMFLTKPNVVAETILRDRGISPIVSTVDDAGDGLVEFFNKLKAM